MLANNHLKISAVFSYNTFVFIILPLRRRSISEPSAQVLWLRTWLNNWGSNNPNVPYKWQRFHYLSRNLHRELTFHLHDYPLHHYHHLHHHHQHPDDELHHPDGSNVHTADVQSAPNKENWTPNTLIPE
jgi:hypothetical protein